MKTKFYLCHDMLTYDKDIIEKNIDIKQYDPDYYYNTYWKNLDYVFNIRVAYSIYKRNVILDNDISIIKTIQKIVNCLPTDILDSQTIRYINSFDPPLFCTMFNNIYKSY